MSSSAITPNTNLANFATASQAGIVSTTAQTFGGKKTFNGGAAILGDTSGTIATGYVGEKLDFTSRSVTGGNQTWVANSSVLVTLTAGTWLIFGSAAFSIIGTAQAVAICTSTTAGSGRIVQMVVVQNSTLNVEGQLPVAYYQVSFGSTQPLYIHGLASGATTGSITVNGFAVRIA